MLEGGFLNICIIPAKGTSTRLPGKNYREFLGKPIICYSIETAQRSGLFSRIAVSTDSAIIARIATSAGVEVWPRRPEWNDDQYGPHDVVGLHLREIQVWSGDIICCMLATAPMMTEGDLKAGYRAMLEPGVMWAFAMGEHPPRDAAQFYWGRTFSFSMREPLVSRYSRMVRIPEERICDIDVWPDFHRAERMYQALHNEAATSSV